jgi:ubiquitin-like protein Pup
MEGDLARAKVVSGSSGPGPVPPIEWLPNQRERSRSLPEQEQKRVQKKTGEGGEAGQVESSGKAEKLKEDMDEILDEIDSVLEENAEEFVKSYVQKGGE